MLGQKREQQLTSLWVSLEENFMGLTVKVGAPYPVHGTDIKACILAQHMAIKDAALLIQKGTDEEIKEAMKGNPPIPQAETLEESVEPIPGKVPEEEPPKKKAPPKSTQKKTVAKTPPKRQKKAPAVTPTTTPPPPAPPADKTVQIFQKLPHPAGSHLLNTQKILTNAMEAFVEAELAQEFGGAEVPDEPFFKGMEKKFTAIFKTPVTIKEGVLPHFTPAGLNILREYMDKHSIPYEKGVPAPQGDITDDSAFSTPHDDSIPPELRAAQAEGGKA